MTTKLGMVMDPIAAIHYKKDSTLAMLLEAHARKWEIYYFEPKDLYARDAIPFGTGKKLKVFANENQWYEFGNDVEMPLEELDIILMRKDPPFNEEYIYATYLLERAEQLGTVVANKPQALRDANEKLFTMQFPQCCPPTLISRSIKKLHEFWQDQGDIVCKPLNTMGGTSVFRIKTDDVNANVIFETLTHKGEVTIMAQRFIPEIKQGDKRILLVNGETIPYALARVPQGEDWRGNLAVGAKGKIQPLSKRDQFICDQVGPVFAKQGLYFVGIDIIGDYLTEINVTSPTGIREIDAGGKVNVSAKLLDCLEHLCHSEPAGRRI